MAYYKITNTKGVLDYELIHGDIADVLDIHYLKDYRRQGYYYINDGIKTCYLSTKETEANEFMYDFIRTLKKEKIKKYVEKLAW